MRSRYSSIPSFKSRTRCALGVVAAALAFSSGVAVADDDRCSAVSGTVSPLQPTQCSSIPSPLGACYQGTVKGDLNGTFQSALQGLQPVTGQPGYFTFSALSAVSLRNGKGSLTTVDAGVASGCQFGSTGLVCPSANEVLVINGGTGKYAQAQGVIALSGGYLAGQPGRYQGVVCRAQGKEADDD